MKTSFASPIAAIVLATLAIALTPAEPTDAQDKQPPSTPIDINLASVTVLTRLPGIGLKRAEQIVAMRAKRPFRRTRDLRRIKGIGSKTFRKIEPLITVGPKGEKANKTRKKRNRRRPAADKKGGRHINRE